MFKLILGGAVLAGSALLAMPAMAQSVGSTSFATIRNCNLVGAGENCDGTGPGQLIAASQFGGGAGVGGSNDFMPSAGNRAWSFVTFDSALDLPEIRAFTIATGNVRMNINATAFQTYTWNGTAPVDFSITGALHIVNSSTSPTGGARPGGAIYTQYVGIWDPAIIAGLTTAQDLFNALFLAPCGTAGVLGAGLAGGTLTGGEATFLATTAACSAGSLTLTPGQSVLVVAGLQLPVNRGAFIDSSATFATRLGDDLTPDVQAEIATGLTSAIAQGAPIDIIGSPGSVPEPASWAMLIAGFGLTGAALRRRSAAAVRLT
jgi:hypothetical protein